MFVANLVFSVGNTILYNLIGADDNAQCIALGRSAVCRPRAVDGRQVYHGFVRGVHRSGVDRVAPDGLDHDASHDAVAPRAPLSQDTLPSPLPIGSLTKYYYSYCTTSDVYGTPVSTSVSTTVVRQ